MQTVTRQPTTETKTFRVSVNWWQNSRWVKVSPDQVALQVTVPSCSHCSTCQGRVKEFSATLARKPNIIHQWKHLDDGAYWLFLPRVKEQDALDLLREVLEVHISRD